MTAPVVPLHRTNGSGRQPAAVEENADLRMEVRVARLDLLTRLNKEREWAYRIGQAVYTGQIDAALQLCGELQREAVEETQRLRARR